MPEDWTPDKPLDDKEAEEEAQNRAKAKARVEYLTQQHKDKATPKKKKGFFDTE